MRKVIDILRLAEAAIARDDGITLEDIKHLLRLRTRTAQRHARLFEAAFPAVENARAVTGPDGGSCATSPWFAIKASETVNWRLWKPQSCVRASMDRPLKPITSNPFAIVCWQA